MDKSRKPDSTHAAEGISRRAAITSLGGGLAMMTTGMLIAGCGSSSGAGNDTLLQGTAQQIAADEVAHVRFLRTAIANAGGTPIAKPAINLNPHNQGFSNANTFLNTARVFEDTGVSAYAGAAPLLTNAQILAAAARILATEAYHAGNVRYQVVRRGLTSTAVDSLDVPPTQTKLFPTDTNGLSPARTPAQVLAIVAPYFPNGINGPISPGTDLEILNFALNLEYLEAEFYSFAVSGAGLAAGDTSGSGTAGATTGGVTVSF